MHSEVDRIAQALQKAGIPCDVVDTGGAVMNAHVVGDCAWIAVSEDGISVFYGDPETDDGSAAWDNIPCHPLDRMERCEGREDLTEAQLGEVVEAVRGALPLIGR